MGGDISLPMFNGYDIVMLVTYTSIKFYKSIKLSIDSFESKIDEYKLKDGALA